MATRRVLVHNPRLAANVRVSGGARFRTLGENVAYGTSSDLVFDMYMQSPPHRANIMDASFRYVGVGWVESAGGQGYTTLIFSSSYSGAYGDTRVAPAPLTAY
jgi:uncharacterized protein YkwD